MTSPATNPGTVASGAAYRCTAYGREFAATSNYVRGGLPHWDDVGPVTRPCTGGSLQPIGGDQLEPSGAGQVEGEGDAGGCGHKDNVDRAADPVHASPRADLTHAGARSAS